MIATAIAAALVPAPARAVPQLAENERGDGVLLYQVLSQVDRPLFAATHAPGQPFGPLSAAGPSRFDLQRAAIDDAGGAVASWRVGPPYLSSPVMAAVRPAGGAFGAPVQLSPPGQNAADVELAVNGRGDAVVAWFSYTNPDMYSFKPAGGTFSPAAEVPGQRSRDLRVAIDANGGVLFFSGRAATAPGQELTYETKYRRPDGAFEATKQLQRLPATVPDYHAVFASSPGGDTVLAWLVGSELHAIERPAGGDFGPEFVVARGVRDDDGNSYRASIADSGDAVITYGGRPLEAAIRRGHGSFSPPQTLGSGVYASAATMNARGDAAVVWANSSRNLLGAYAPAGSGFGAGQLLGAIPFGVGGQLITPPLSPDVAIDGSGRATAVWEQGDGETVRLQSRDIGAAGPGPLTTAETVSAFDQVAPPSACTPSGGRVLLRGSRAVVVRTPGGTFGCLLARGELVPLNRTYPYPRGDASPTQPYQPPAMTLAGPFLASVVEIGNHDASTSTLMTLTDLRDEVSGIGRAANATPPARGQVGERAVVPALKLKPNGAMAWIACAVDFRRPPNVRRTCRRPGGLTKQLWAWNLADGKPRLVAHGKRIDPRTLKLNGSRLTWKAGKRHRAATLQ